MRPSPPALWIGLLLGLAVGGSGGSGPARAAASGRDLEPAPERAAQAVGDPAAAEARWRAEAARRPLSAAAWEGLVDELERQDRRAEAARTALRGGERLLAAGLAAEAERLARRAEELGADRGRVLRLLGPALVQRRAYREAEPVLRAALERGRDARTALYLGSTLWENGRLDEAEAVLRDLAAIAPATAEPLLGRLLVWRGHHAEAVPLLERSLARRPEAVDLLFARARALEGAGETSRALEAYRALVAVAPGFAPARHGLGALLARAGDRAGAERELAAYRRLYEEEIRRTREEGLLQARLDAALDVGRRGDTAAALERLAALPPSPDVLAASARVRLAAGDREGAIAALERAVLADPDRRDLGALLAELRLATEGDR